MLLDGSQYSTGFGSGSEICELGPRNDDRDSAVFIQAPQSAGSLAQPAPQEAPRPLPPRERLLETVMVGMRLEFTELLMEDTENDVSKVQAFFDREVFPRARATAQTIIAGLKDSEVDTLNKPPEQLTEAEVALVTRVAVKLKDAFQTEIVNAFPKSSLPSFRLPPKRKPDRAQ